MVERYLISSSSVLLLSEDLSLVSLLNRIRVESRRGLALAFLLKGVRCLPQEGQYLSILDNRALQAGQRLGIQ